MSISAATTTTIAKVAEEWNPQTLSQIIYVAHVDDPLSRSGDGFAHDEE